MSVATARVPIRTIARREIENRIIRGAIRPGNQLKLGELSESTGIGVTPLREALIEVERSGLLHNHPGRGFFVPPLTLEEAAALYPLIWTLEGLGVRSTAIFTPEHLEGLRRINDRFAEVEGDAVRALEIDSEWHHELVSKCGNTLLLETLAGVKRRAERYQFAFQQSAGHWPVSVRHHEEIVSALDGGYREEAIALLEANWAPGPKFMGEWLG